MKLFRLAAPLTSAGVQRLMTMRAEERERISALVETACGVVTAAVDAIRNDETVASRLRNLLVASNRLGTSGSLAPHDEFRATTRDVIEAIVLDLVKTRAEHLAEIRRFFLEPHETYGIDELATLWRVASDEVRNIFHDQLLAWREMHPAEPDALRIAWAEAVNASVTFTLLRPFDVERALAEDFVRARPEKWRTVAVFVRLPRFVCEVLSTAPHSDLAADLERFVLDQVQGGYWTGAILRSHPADLAMVTRRSEESRQRRGVVRTPLQRLLKDRQISSAQIEAKLRERLGDRAPDPKVVLRWRLGRSEPRRKNMVRLLWAVREAADDPTIRIEDIVDLDPNNPANWED